MRMSTGHRAWKGRVAKHCRNCYTKRGKVYSRYASGRFCSRECARSYSTAHRNLERSRKIRATLLQRLHGPKPEPTEARLEAIRRDFRDDYRREPGTVLPRNHVFHPSGKPFVVTHHFWVQGRKGNLHRGAVLTSDPDSVFTKAVLAAGWVRPIKEKQ